MRVIVIGSDARGFKKYVDAERRSGFEYILVPDRSLHSALRVQGIPDLVVIDPNGRIAFRNHGFGNGSEALITSQIEALLAESSGQHVGGGQVGGGLFVFELE